VDHREDIRDFLTSRRARITPQQAGLPTYGGNRRVAGLRREEVALMAGVSVDYYTRLERGNLSGVSESVLDAVARALHLDDAERGHLFDLARVANASPRTRRRTVASGVRPSVQRVLDAMSGAPAWVHNDRLDFLAANRLGYALYSELFADPTTRSSRTSSASYRPEARTSASDGPPTTSGCTALASRDCNIQSSAFSTSPTRRWNCRVTRA
jgi:transcriptional regulator with XRE-family HTH domain